MVSVFDPCINIHFSLVHGQKLSRVDSGIVKWRCIATSQERNARKHVAQITSHDDSVFMAMEGLGVHDENRLARAVCEIYKMVDCLDQSATSTSSSLRNFAQCLAIIYIIGNTREPVNTCLFRPSPGFGTLILFFQCHRRPPSYFQSRRSILPRLTIHIPMSQISLIHTRRMSQNGTTTRFPRQKDLRHLQRPLRTSSL